ncbi:MAG: OstA-like protein [Flavobacteriaceae bacterium]
MKTLYPIYFLLIACFFSAPKAFSQEKRKIEIKYSGRLNIDEEKYPGAKILTRDDAQQVHIAHGSINMWSDKAIYYTENNFIEAYGNVKMVEGDTINMVSKYIEYSGISQLAFASGNVVLTDPNSTIKTDTLYFDRQRQEAFYKCGGTVEKDTSGIITSKIGRYLMQLKKYRFTDSVVLTNPDAVIKSNYFDFYSDTGEGYLYGPSTITTETSKTYCEKGFYDTKNKVGYAVKNSRIDYDNRIIEGDSLYFDNTKSFASATNNIKVTDTINKTIITGHYAEVFKEKDSLFITKRALASTKQENDSIYMHAEKIMVTGKPEHRVLRAYYKAKIYKSDLSGKADSIHSDQKTGITKLINIDRFKSSDKFSVKRHPVMWNIDNQMTGDTIYLYANTKTEKLDSLLVHDNAFVISKDTISTDGYNQINGKYLVGYFNDKNELDKVDVTKNAQSIFYVRDDKQELIGIDKAKSGSISIVFSEGDIETYSRFNQIDGDLHPESKYPAHEKQLKGFDWRNDERPLNINDLFKEEDPFELPKIQGLEDYVPEDDFFNEEMMMRIDMAGHDLMVRNDENLLVYPNNFENSVWIKSQISIKENIETAPDGSTSAYKIIGTGKSNGYITQVTDKINGTFEFSVWLKGEGNIKLTLQENGGDYTSYNKTIDIALVPKWKKYSIEATKENDGNKVRGIISWVQTDDNFYIWGASLIEIQEQDIE